MHGFTLIEANKRVKEIILSCVKNNYKEINCVAILDKNKIVITKNKNSISLFEDKYGASIYMKLNKSYILMTYIHLLHEKY